MNWTMNMNMIGYTVYGSAHNKRLECRKVLLDVIWMPQYKYRQYNQNNIMMRHEMSWKAASTSVDCRTVVLFNKQATLLVRCLSDRLGLFSWMKYISWWFSETHSALRMKIWTLQPACNNYLTTCRSVETPDNNEKADWNTVPLLCLQPSQHIDFVW